MSVTSRVSVFFLGITATVWFLHRGGGGGIGCWVLLVIYLFFLANWIQQEDHTRWSCIMIIMSRMQGFFSIHKSRNVIRHITNSRFCFSFALWGRRTPVLCLTHHPPGWWKLSWLSVDHEIPAQYQTELSCHHALNPFSKRNILQTWFSFGGKFITFPPSHLGRVHSSPGGAESMP